MVRRMTLMFALALAGFTVASTAAPASARTTTRSERTILLSEVWSPSPGTTWQWQLVQKVDPTALSVEMVDLDLFDARPGQINEGVIDALHANGIVAICYLDTGAWESYRPDAWRFPRSVLGNRSYASNGDPWVGERWLDIRRRSWPKFAPIMWRRLDLAARLGCDGVEPDQNNSWGNKPGFPITKADEKAWYLKVAREAHRRGLSVGMKNGIEVIDAEMVAAFDWALNEECFQYAECGRLMPFIHAGKAVFNTEYRGEAATFCPRARARGFSSLKKHLALGPWRIAC
jgi:hypothetical protein